MTKMRSTDIFCARSSQISLQHHYCLLTDQVKYMLNTIPSTRLSRRKESNTLLALLFQLFRAEQIFCWEDSISLTFKAQKQQNAKRNFSLMNIIADQNHARK